MAVWRLLDDYYFFFGILSFFLMEIEAPLKVLIANNTKYIEYVQSLYF